MSTHADTHAVHRQTLADLQRPFRWGAHGVTSPSRAFALPIGTVTFLLTDVEGSTRLWSSESAETMHAAMGRQLEILARAVDENEGVRPQEQGEGDSIVAAFARPSDALRAALAAQRALGAEAWPTRSPILVRMAIHTGEAELRDDANYAGQAIIRCARLRALGHGGQVLVSGATRDLAIDQVAAEFELRPLGEHRLRDLGRPEVVWQLAHPELRAEFPPLVSLDASPHNLPVVMAPFIGRLEEIDTLSELVRSNRLVTATGAGGAGKTRLAQQVGAHVLDEFTAGVWWVELAAVTPEGVEGAVRLAIGMSDTMNVALEEAVRRKLDGRRSLLIIDNCEHVTGSVAPLVARLMSTAPTLHILATSRVTLDLPGELPWRVPSLALPDRHAALAVEVLSQFDAVRVFCDRARRARPNFRLDDDNGPAIAELCHRLDGIPLALELAAARCRMMSPMQILEGLDDSMRLLTGGSRALMPRQQTLEASIGWSVDLLTDAERVLLARLSVFVGGWALQAAETVCADSTLSSYAVFDALDRLVDHSLVTVSDAKRGSRFSMLETVCQFAWRMLSAEAGERSSVRDRHCAYFVDLVDSWNDRDHDDLYDLAELIELDEANTNASFDHLVHRGEIERAAELLFPLNDLTGRPNDNRRRCELVLAHPGSTGTTAAVVALSGRSWASLNRGQAADGVDDARAAVQLAEQLGDAGLVDVMRVRLLYLEAGSGGDVRIAEMIEIAERIAAR